MKSRFILFRRGKVFYCEDTTTGKQTSLKTKDKTEAATLLNARNEAFRQPQLNVQIARAYLAGADPGMSTRTWQVVMDQMKTHGKAATQYRCASAMRSKAFDPLRNKALAETNAEDILLILKTAKVSEAHYLRRLHNLAIGLGWLAMPVLAPRLWPKPKYRDKRGITLEEHQRILAAVQNPERRLFYEFLWEVGASQSDAAALKAEDLDWSTRTLTYFRMKTGDLHVIDDFDDTRAREWFAALDYGFTHYTVCLLGCTDGDGNVFVVDEHAERLWLPQRRSNRFQTKSVSRRQERCRGRGFYK